MAVLVVGLVIVVFVNTGGDDWFRIGYYDCSGCRWVVTAMVAIGSWVVAVEVWWSWRLCWWPVVVMVA